MNINLYKNILFFGIIPLTILGFILIFIYWKKKKIPKFKKNKIILMIEGLLCIIYTIYCFIFSLNKLISLKDFDKYPNKIPTTILLIVIPMIPFLFSLIVYSSYQKLKRIKRKEENYE